MKNVKRLIVYIIGLFIIAVGINVSKMSGLGISPVSSIPRALEVIWGFTLGTTTILVYCLLVLAQFLILRSKFRLVNILGIPVAIVFGFMVDLVGINPNAFGHLLYNFPRPETYPLRLVYLIASLFIIGIGVFTYLQPNLIPMPAEGLAGAIFQKLKTRPFGDCKTMVDMSMICIALVLQLIFLGGIKSFTGDVVVVREGTIISAFCVGQVVKLLNRIASRRKNKTAV